jgi:hypothetical protein
MKATFKVTLLKDGELNATGIVVPPEVIEAFGKGKKPPVNVTVNGYTYSSTVAVMGGLFMLPLAQVHRAAAGVSHGETIEVTLELVEGERTVDVPESLASALAAKPGAREAFDKLNYSTRKEHARQVNDAKTDETRDRRIAKIVDGLG